MSAENRRLNKGMILEYIVIENFEKMFSCQKQEKMFIQMPNSRFEIFDWHKVLVFDMNNDVFHFVDNFLPLLYPNVLIYNNIYLDFTLGKYSPVYGIYQYQNFSNREKPVSTDTRVEMQVCIEIRSFRFLFDKLVDNGIK